MPDTRSQVSEMPPHILAIWEDLEPSFMAIMTRLGVEAKVAGIGRDPAEVENDVLSLQSQLAAVTIATFIGDLAQRKALPIEVVAPVAFQDVVTRTELLLQGMIAMRQAPGETKR